MYKYDQYDQAMVDTRVEEFRDQVRRRLEGHLPRTSSSRCGCRTASTCNSTPTCCASPCPMARSIRRRCGAGRHRRQVRSRLWPLHHPPEHPVQLDQAGGDARYPRRSRRVEMHAIQTSGNCIRNISSDQYAGAAADEIVDPRPYAELLRQWSSFHPEFLPAAQVQDRGDRQRTDRAAMRCTTSASRS
jgi:sulfite reductase (NADPH) hemoprotein beta-component